MKFKSISTSYNIYDCPLCETQNLVDKNKNYAQLLQIKCFGCGENLYASFSKNIKMNNEVKEGTITNDRILTSTRSATPTKEHPVLTYPYRTNAYNLPKTQRSEGQIAHNKESGVKVDAYQSMSNNVGQDKLLGNNRRQRIKGINVFGVILGVFGLFLLLGGLYGFGTVVLFFGTWVFFGAADDGLPGAIMAGAGAMLILVVPLVIAITLLLLNVVIRMSPFTP